MKHKSHILLFVTLLLTVCFSCNIKATHAQETLSPIKKAEELQNFYRNLESISFDFKQTSWTAGRERTGSGNAFFAKPKVEIDTGISPFVPQGPTSIMRWNYNEPDKQIIINDGVTLSIYTDKDHQLIKTSALELESDITYAFFAGTRDLLEDFEALPGDTGSYTFSNAEKLQAIKLVPRKPHNQIKEVFIWSGDDNIIHHMVIVDHFDSITELHFSNIKVNSVQVDDKKAINSIISFPIPPGTEIITQ